MTQKRVYANGCERGRLCEQPNNQWRAAFRSLCSALVRVVVKTREERNGADIDEAEENEIDEERKGGVAVR